MESYFFIPAARKDFVENVQHLGADHFIFDFEDSIDTSKLDDALETVSNITIDPGFFVRFYWYDRDADRSYFYIDKLIGLGFRNFVIPKFHGKEELDRICEFLRSYPQFPEFKVILLIENPQSLMDIPAILASHRPFGVALGSHDYCAEMNMLHTSGNISWARNYLLNSARSAAVQCIDYASMNLVDEAEMELQLRDAFNMGFEGKLLIHPWQLEMFRRTTYFTPDELEIALKLKEKIEEIGGIANFTIARIGGIVIEKPHLGRYFRILKMAGHESS